jgi:hypothetical protein
MEYHLKVRAEVTQLPKQLSKVPQHRQNCHVSIGRLAADANGLEKMDDGEGKTKPESHLQMKQNHIYYDLRPKFCECQPEKIVAGQFLALTFLVNSLLVLLASEFVQKGRCVFGTNTLEVPGGNAV